MHSDKHSSLFSMISRGTMTSQYSNRLSTSPKYQHITQHQHLLNIYNQLTAHILRNVSPNNPSDIPAHPSSRESTIHNTPSVPGSFSIICPNPQPKLKADATIPLTNLKPSPN